MENGGAEGVIEAAQIDTLIRVLAARGYTVVDPTLRDGAIVYDELSSMSDLPIGWADE